MMWGGVGLYGRPLGDCLARWGWFHWCGFLKMMGLYIPGNHYWLKKPRLIRHIPPNTFELHLFQHPCQFAALKRPIMRLMMKRLPRCICLFDDEVMNDIGYTRSIPIPHLKSNEPPFNSIKNAR